MQVHIPLCLAASGLCVYMKVKNASDEYLTYAPYSNYKYRLDKFNFLFGESDIETIGKSHLDKFESILRLKYKPMTVRDNLTIVKVFLNWSLVNGYTRYNPRYFKIPKVFCRRTVLSWEEYKKMCSLLNPDDFHDLRLILIMKFLAMGLRCGEVTRLNISDFNNIMGTIPEDKMFAIVESEKSKRERIILWNKETNDLLIRYLGVRVCLNKENWLFGSSDETSRRKRITTRSIQRWFKELKDRAQIIRPVTPHSVRHMTAHIMNDKGASIKAIQIKLGHSHISSTGHYLEYDPLESVKTLYNYRLV